jgi:formamidopyrimidine-DNA glycosylase
MPELPDLQVFRKNLEKRFTGKKIINVDVTNSLKINVSQSTLNSKLKGKKLKGIIRNGKELFFNFEGEQVLSFHLMLNGEFHLFKGANNYKNKILELLFEDENGLVVTDWQQYANVKLNPKIPEVPDAFSNKFNFEYLKNGFAKYKSRRIKDLLVDQKFVRGIGNAYVDEILWSAKIHPLSKAGKIPNGKIEELYNSINQTLVEAEEEIIKRNPDIIRGEIRDFLKVHNPKVTHSPTGGIIKKENLGNRVTYYTEEQVFYE